MILLVFIYRPRLSYRLVVFYSLSLLASLVHITCISVELCLCINMSGCLCLSVCLALCLSACLFVCLPLSLFPYQSVYRRSDCPFLYLPALHILIRKAMCTSVYACLCVCLSVCVYVCLTVCLPVRLYFKGAAFDPALVRCSSLEGKSAPIATIARFQAKIINDKHGKVSVYSGTRPGIGAR